MLSCATVVPFARIGRFAGVRAGAMLGHHCVIHDHTYVGPNATMCGRSVLQDAAHLGPGSVLMDRKILGRYSVAVGRCHLLSRPPGAQERRARGRRAESSFAKYRIDADMHVAARDRGRMDSWRGQCRT